VAIVLRPLSPARKAMCRGAPKVEMAATRFTLVRRGMRPGGEAGEWEGVRPWGMKEENRHGQMKGKMVRLFDGSDWRFA
jgi:hypothetical protein